MTQGESIAIIAVTLAVIYIIVFSDGSNGKGKR